MYSGNRTLMGHRLGWPLLLVLLLCFTTTRPSAQSGSAAEFVLRAPAAVVADIAARYGLTIVRQLNGQDVFLVRKSTLAVSFLRSSDSGSSVTQSSEVDTDPLVVSFEPNVTITTPEVQSKLDGSVVSILDGSVVSILDGLGESHLVNYFDNQVWNHYVDQPATTAIGLEAGHAAAGSGAGIVAIIDTGVDPDHPALSSSLVPGYDFIHETEGAASEWTDLDGSVVSILDGSVVSILDGQSPVTLNGSVVAILDQQTAAQLDTSLLPRSFGHGTMVAGLVHLVAPGARIMPLKAFSADGTSTVFDVVRAIYYAIDHGARVINMSFSASTASPEITHAINEATSRGIICVASAGNLGEETLVYPGALRNVIGVGSTTSTSPALRSSFSNYGDALVSVGAPGEAVITTYPGGHYAASWGTSFSAPLAAGGAALLVRVDPTVDQGKAAESLGKAQPMSGGMGKGRLNLADAVRTVADVVPPSVSLTAPTSGGALFGNVLISASASDNVKVSSVRFLLDQHPLGAEVTAAPFERMWATASLPNGSHTLTAIARDASGNESSALANITIANDTDAPTVAVTSPSMGATVNGTVTLAATASDDLEVRGVRFMVDGIVVGDELTRAPYETSWTTAIAANGVHTIAAIARDAAGHESTSSLVVTVANADVTAPTVSLVSPASGATLSGTVNLAATASDNMLVFGVLFKVDGIVVAGATSEPYEAAFDTARLPNGTHTLSAVAFDDASNETATSVDVTVYNDAPPTVQLTTPVAGAGVSGMVGVLAAATDDLGVAGVQFLVDGAPAGAEDTAAPYELIWDSSHGANGMHTLTAVARDAAGHVATASLEVSITNDIAAPTVALATTAGSPASGVVSFSATASDDIGVVGVTFSIDGVPVGSEVTSAPYELSWNSENASNGVHTVSAVARDASGHESSASVAVTVSNDHAAPVIALSRSGTGTTGVMSFVATASDDIGVVGVLFSIDGVPSGTELASAPYEWSWNSATVANGSHVVTVRARDAAGHETTASLEVVASNDLAAPVVALSSPAAGTPASGTVSFIATATDDIGVAAVQFMIDGVAFGNEVTAAPYELSWNTATASNGAHTVTAVAHDAAGHQTEASVEILVSNDLADPALALNSPSGLTVKGLVGLVATAVDDVGVVSVEFLVDGASAASVTSAPYEWVWDATSAADGAHTITAVARDAAGHQATATLVLTVTHEEIAPIKLD